MGCCLIGQMSHRIQIQRYYEVADAFGELTKTYHELATVWAKITPLTGKERVEALKVQAETTHSILIRYRSDVEPNMRILYDGRYMEITAAINLKEEDRFMQLLCTEIVGASVLPTPTPTPTPA